MNATCNGCGTCCDPVVLPYPHIRAMTDPALPLRDRQWAQDDLTPMSAKEALTKVPWLRGRTLVDQFGNLNLGFYFRCRQFDPETRQCRSYDDRPGTCRNYPWYNGDPSDTAALAPWCSFNTDRGVVPEPVPVALLPTRNRETTT